MKHKSTHAPVQRVVVESIDHRWDFLLMRLYTMPLKMFGEFHSCSTDAENA